MTNTLEILPTSECYTTLVANNLAQCETQATIIIKKVMGHGNIVGVSFGHVANRLNGSKLGGAIYSVLMLQCIPSG